jgi:nicotinamide-nucleotide amidase
MSFQPESLRQAVALLDGCRALDWKLVLAESCTGGLIGAYLTEIPGSSDVLDRGFVVYSNTAKSELLGVPPALIATHGAVSEEVARAMAQGALAASPADLAISCTGIAGPAGGSRQKPVGRVYMAAARRGGEVRHRMVDYGAIGRGPIRQATVLDALKLALELIAEN